MEVSVVIPSYNGRHKLPDILRALSLQTYENFEVVIVIDGSTDDSATMLRSMSFSIPLRVIEQENKGRAGVRNRGVQEAKGDLIVFLDDDSIPASDCIARHVRFHSETKDALLTGGTPQLLSENASDFLRYRAYLSERWISHFPEGVLKMNDTNFFLVAQNCSMPRSVFTTLSGFNEALTDAEDKELAMRARAAGFDLYYDRHTVAFHNEAPTFRSYIRRLRQYAEAEKKLFAGKHEELQLSGMKKVIYYLLASAFLARSVDTFNFFLILPKKLRYKIYDAITFSLSKIHPSVRV